MLALFAFFDRLPYSLILSIIGLILVFIFVVTSVDSATFVLGMLTTRGSMNPPVRRKLTWGITLGALGAALTVWHDYLDQARTPDTIKDSMQGSYLGPQFSNQEIKSYLDGNGTDAVYSQIEDSQLLPKLAQLMDQGNVIGWFNGRMEFSTGLLKTGPPGMIGACPNKSRKW